MALPSFGGMRLSFPLSCTRSGSGSSAAKKSATSRRPNEDRDEDRKLNTTNMSPPTAGPSIDALVTRTSGTTTSTSSESNRPNRMKSKNSNSLQLSHRVVGTLAGGERNYSNSCGRAGAAAAGPVEPRTVGGIRLLCRAMSKRGKGRAHANEDRFFCEEHVRLAPAPLPQKGMSEDLFVVDEALTPPAAAIQVQGEDLISTQGAAPPPRPPPTISNRALSNRSSAASTTTASSRTSSNEAGEISHYTQSGAVLEELEDRGDGRLSPQPCPQSSRTSLVQTSMKMLSPPSTGPPPPASSKRTEVDLSMVGILDGHDGAYCADLVAQELPGRVMMQLLGKGPDTRPSSQEGDGVEVEMSPAEIFKQADESETRTTDESRPPRRSSTSTSLLCSVHEAHAEAFAQCEDLMSRCERDRSGCCVNSVLFHDGNIYCANLGDCRTVYIPLGKVGGATAPPRPDSVAAPASCSRRTSAKAEAVLPPFGGGAQETSDEEGDDATLSLPCGPRDDLLHNRSTTAESAASSSSAGGCGEEEGENERPLRRVHERSTTRDDAEEVGHKFDVIGRLSEDRAGGDKGNVIGELQPGRNKPLAAPPAPRVAAEPSSSAQPLSPTMSRFLSQLSFLHPNSILVNNDPEANNSSDDITPPAAGPSRSELMARSTSEQAAEPKYEMSCDEVGDHVVADNNHSLTLQLPIITPLGIPHDPDFQGHESELRLLFEKQQKEQRALRRDEERAHKKWRESCSETTNKMTRRHHQPQKLEHDGFYFGSLTPAPTTAAPPSASDELRLGQFVWLSRDMRGSKPYEEQRLRRMGVDSFDCLHHNGRIGGCLEPSRTIGDLDIKQMLPPGVVSIMPETRCLDAKHADRHSFFHNDDSHNNSDLLVQGLVIQGTDGLWDALDGNEIQRCLAETAGAVLQMQRYCAECADDEFDPENAEAIRSLEQVVEKIHRTAYKKWRCTDDCTLIVSLVTWQFRNSEEMNSA